jgi:hypothetical protein
VFRERGQSGACGQNSRLGVRIILRDTPAITAALPSPGNDESTHPDGVSRIPGTTHALATTSTLPYDNATRFYSQVLQYG